MLAIIYNPVAGSGKSKKTYELVLQELEKRKVIYSTYETRAKNDAKNIACMLNGEGKNNIIVIGGDGTIHEVLNGIINISEVCLGILPAGSGNDTAFSLGIPENPIEALDVILRGKTSFVDYLECSGVRGINSVGTGIDVEILKKCYKSKRLNGKLKYLLSTISCIATYRDKRFQLDNVEKNIKHEGLIICAGNGKAIGGGIKICPDALMDDGLIDFVVIDSIPNVFMKIKALIKMMKGKAGEIPQAEYTRVKSISAEFDVPTDIQIDGEIYKNLKFSVSLIHEKLKVYMP